MVLRDSSAMWQLVSFPLFPWLWSCILSIGKGGCEQVGVSSYWVRLDSALQGIAECPVLSLHGEEGPGVTSEGWAVSL